MKLLILAFGLTLAGPAFATTYGTPDTCTGDFSGDNPLVVTGERLFDGENVCNLEGQCASVSGETWSHAFTAKVTPDTVTITYENGEEEGDVVLKRCDSGQVSK